MPCRNLHTSGPDRVTKTGKAEVDFVSAPSSYEELFRKYYNYVVALVRKMGIDDSRKEDVASEILLRFYERDFLNKFDPTKEFVYQGTIRPARFKSFLSRFVVTYVRGHSDKHRRLADHELLLCDDIIGEYKNTRWFDHFGGAAPSHEDAVLDRLEEEQFVAYLRRHLARIEKKSQRDRCDLVALFDAVVAQIRTRGEWHVEELAHAFCVGTTTMHTWIWWLRENLADILDRPVPAKRGAKPDVAAPELVTITASAPSGCPQCGLLVSNFDLHQKLHGLAGAA